MANVATMFLPILAYSASRNHSDSVSVGSSRSASKRFSEYPFLTRWRLNRTLSKLQKLQRARAISGKPEGRREARLWDRYFELLSSIQA